MSNAGTVTLYLDANSIKLLRELQRSQRATERTAKKMRSKMVGTFTAIRKSVLSAGAAMGAFSAFRGLTRITGEIDKMGKLVDRLGGSTEAFSELQFAANRTGVTFETLTMGLQRMQRRVAEAAQNTGEAKDALRELGLNARALTKLTLDQQFERIADALNQVKESGDKTRLTMKLFDSEGVALLQTMKGGASAIRALRQEARDLGASLSRDQVAAATAAKDAMDNLNASSEALSRTLAVRLAPALELAADGMRKFLGGEAVDEEIARLEASLARMERFTTDFQGRGPSAGSGAAIMIQEIKDRLAELRESQVEVNTVVDELGEIFTAAKSKATPYANELRNMIKGMQSAEQRANKLRFALKLFGDELNPDQIRAVNAEINKILTSGIEEIDVGKINALKKPIDTLEKYYKRKAAQMVANTRTPVEQFNRDMRALLANPYVDEQTLQRQVQVLIKTLHNGLDAMDKDMTDFQRQMEAMSEQAARNMQDAFADFLFDPFEDGLKGMLRSFIDTLRRMVANQLALQIFSWFKGFNLFGIGGRATGGPVAAGTPYMVGERGPELFIPGSSGTVIPNNRLTSGGNVFNFTNNVTSNGSMDAQTLIPILEENNRKVKSEFLDELNRGQYD